MVGLLISIFAFLAMAWVACWYEDNYGAPRKNRRK
jgi:hypothetical protein